jgi:putative Holliday junction resolvase
VTSGTSDVGTRNGRRLIGLDIGSKRIGVAVSDETALIATPLRTVARGGGERAEIADLVREWNAERLVVGLPTGLSGREGPQAAAVRNYADALATALDVPLTYWDERLTTAIAERALIEAGHRRAQRKERIDAVAAAVILQSYLDAVRMRQNRGVNHEFPR